MTDHQSDEERAAEETRAAEAARAREKQDSLDATYRELEAMVSTIGTSSGSDVQPASATKVISAIRHQMESLWQVINEPDPPQLDYPHQFELLYRLWRRSVTLPDEVIDYCDERLQWLESRLAGLGSDDGPMSARSAFGPDIESEIAALQREIQKQERILERQHRGITTNVTPLSPTTINTCESKLVWRGTQTDVARFLHDFIQEGIIEEHGIVDFVARHILLRDTEGKLQEIDRKNFASILRQFRTPSGTAKGSRKINEALDRARKKT